MSPNLSAIDLRKAPISRVLLPFLLGIIAWDISSLAIRIEIIWSVTIVCWAGFYIFFRYSLMERAVDHLIFSILGAILFLGTGYSLRSVKHSEAPLLPTGQRVVIRGEVIQDPVETGTGWLVEFKMKMLVYGDTCSVKRTKLKTYYRKPLHGAHPGTGEQWQLSGTLSPIRNRGNPGEADYEAIMARKGYLYRFFIDEDTRINRMVSTKGSRRFNFSGLREQIAGYWAGDQETAALMSAVCLGDRSGLTDDQKQSYRDAGGMHLLAVSGLHIGLIWWILHRVLAVMVRLFHRELYRTLPIVVILWFYAFLTGFSSSVWRAVTMFTLFSLALLINQRTHPLNCLLVSAFLITAVDPERLRDVGFQLSFAAMFGIVTLFPWIRQLPGKRIQHRTIRWVWEATCVSIAAQVSTAPLVIFYFHQLPAFALLTNLIAIPILSLLIALFVLTLPFLSLDLFPYLISRVMHLTALLMNRTMDVIAGFPGAVIRDLYLDRVTLGILLIMLILGAVALKGDVHWPRYGLIFSLAGLLGWSSVSILTERNQTSLVVCQFNRGSQVMFTQGRRVDCYCFTKDSLSAEVMTHYLASSWQHSGYDIMRIECGDSTAARGNISACHPLGTGCWLLGNDLIRGWIIAGEPGPQIIELLIQDPGEFIILRDNPKLPARSLKEIPVEATIIADGSNSTWYAESVQEKLPQLHATSHLGAYMRTW